MTDEAIANAAHAAIALITSLEDHVNKFVKEKHGTKDAGRSFVKASHELKVIKDLRHRDEHGGEARTSESGLFPRLENINRVFQLGAGTGPGGATYTMGPSGTQRVSTSGSGFGKVVITGDVVDKDGAPLFDLHKLLSLGVSHWETYFTSLGLCPNCAFFAR